MTLDLPTTLHAPPPTWTPAFSVPAAVTVLDLTEDPATAGDRLAAQARAALPGVGDDQVAHLVAARRAIVDRLVSGGVYWAGSCVARSDVDPGRLTVAHLAASVLHVGTDRIEPAAVVADLNGGDSGPLSEAGVSGRVANRVADVVQLPVGPAIVVISEQVVRPALTAVGTPDGTEHHVRQLLVAVQVPDAPRLAVLTLATDHLADWSAYVDLMATIARSLEFRRG